MRVTKRTNIAFRLLMYCAANPGRLVTKSEIAECCNISANHLAQVINQLSRLGYLATQRGRNGGLRLGQEVNEIRVGSVFRQIEGEVPHAECFADADNTCPLVDACRLKLAFRDAAATFYAALDEITLDSLVCENADLLALLQPVQCAHSRPARPIPAP